MEMLNLIKTALQKNMEYAVGDAVELEVNGVWHAGYISQREEPRVAHFKYDAARFRMYCEPLDLLDPDDAARLRRGPRSAKRANAAAAPAKTKPVAKKPAARKPAARKPPAKARAKKSTATKAKKPAARPAKKKRTATKAKKKPATKAPTAAERARLADIGDRVRSALLDVAGDAPWLEGLALVEFAPCRPETSRRDMGPGRVNLHRAIEHRATWTHEASGASLVVKFNGDHCMTYEQGDDGAWIVGMEEEADMAYSHASGVGCASMFSAIVEIDFEHDGQTHSASVHFMSGDHPREQGMDLSLGFRTDAGAFKRAIRDSLGSEALGLPAGSKRAMSLEHFCACAFGGLVVMDPFASFLHMLRPGAYLDTGSSWRNNDLSRNFAKVARALYYDAEGECRVAAASFVAYPPDIFADPAGAEGARRFHIW